MSWSNAISAPQVTEVIFSLISILSLVLSHRVLRHLYYLRVLTVLFRLFWYRT